MKDVFIHDQLGVPGLPVCPGPAGRGTRVEACQLSPGNYRASRTTIDSGDRVMPRASDEELAVPWTMAELVAFWLPALYVQVRSWPDKGSAGRKVTFARPGPYSPLSHPRRDRRVIILGDGDPAACRLAGGHPAAQSRPVGGDQAAPDPVLADVPVLQG
jgi:hypothetical protein